MSLLTQLSPGVLVREIDLTTIVPSVGVSIGAVVGQFGWGPVDHPVLIGDSRSLVQRFYIPTTRSSLFAASSFFSAYNFLSYPGTMWVNRTVGTGANNALAASLSASGNAVSLLIKSEKDFEQVHLFDKANNEYGPFAAKYPGSLGNSLTVSICSDASKFESWAYSLYFPNPPGTSEYAANKNSANDEMHIVVIDTEGRVTGTRDTVIETFPFVSKASDATDVTGVNSYWKHRIFENSSYIYAMDPVDYANTANNWAYSTDEINEFVCAPNVTVSLSNGADGDVPSASDLAASWNIFQDSDSIDVNLLIMGASADISPVVIQHVIDNVVDGGDNYPIYGRRDTMVFFSPRYDDVVRQPGQEAQNIVQKFLPLINRGSSYAVCDSGWKYQLDIYNNIYRWVPLNADVAGLCALTDDIAQPWFSPAGFNRGKIKNVLKLAWNPKKAERDFLYQNGVNSVCSFTGEGTVLFGDKTLQGKPSAFDRINVRRLFIVLEKAISKAAQYSLFELNDVFTRNQFIAMVEPYLRQVKALRGVYDFKVVCDTSNNTPDVIDRNFFVGDIYIKPTRSINFIQLNFIATRTGVDFNTVVGNY